MSWLLRVYGLAWALYTLSIPCLAQQLPACSIVIKDSTVVRSFLQKVIIGRNNNAPITQTITIRPDQFVCNGCFISVDSTKHYYALYAKDPNILNQKKPLSLNELNATKNDGFKAAIEESKSLSSCTEVTSVIDNQVRKGGDSIRVYETTDKQAIVLETVLGDAELARLQVVYPLKNGIRRIKQLGEYYYIDSLGQPLRKLNGVAARYDYAADFTDNTAIVGRATGTHGDMDYWLINKQGLAISISFSAYEEAFGGYRNLIKIKAGGADNSNSTLIDRNGHILIRYVQSIDTLNGFIISDNPTDHISKDYSSHFDELPKEFHSAIDGTVSLYETHDNNFSPLELNKGSGLGNGAVKATYILPLDANLLYVNFDYKYGLFVRQNGVFKLAYSVKNTLYIEYQNKFSLVIADSSYFALNRLYFNRAAGKLIMNKGTDSYVHIDNAQGYLNGTTVIKGKAMHQFLNPDGTPASDFYDALGGTPDSLGYFNFRSKDHWGIAMIGGNTILEPTYDLITAFDKRGFALGCKDSHLYLISRQGKPKQMAVISSSGYPSVIFDGFNNDGLSIAKVKAEFWSNETYYLININGDVLYSSEMPLIFKDAQIKDVCYVSDMKDSIHVYIKDKHLLVRERIIRPFKDGYAVTQCTDGGAVFIDTLGHQFPSYTYCLPYDNLGDLIQNNYVIVQKAHEYGIIKLNTGEKLLPPKIDQIEFKDERFLCRSTSYNFVLKIPSAGKVLLDCVSGDCDVYQRLLAEQK